MKLDRGDVFSMTDARGFVYALEPYLQKQVWLQERLENQLAQASRLLLDAREQRRQLDEDFEFQMKSLSMWMHTHPSPQTYQRGLLYLAHLRIEMKRQDQLIEMLLLQKEAKRAKCIEQQLRLDGLADHRTSKLREYTNNQARLAASEADRDWIGRAALTHPSDCGVSI